MLSPSIRTAASSALVLGLLLLTVSCSGGGKGGGTPAPGLLRVEITNLNQQFAASDGVLGITFNVLGPGSTLFELLVQFGVPNGPSGVDAAQVPLPLANAINALNPGVNMGQIPLQGNQLPPADSETFQQFTFWWYAGADLGFLETLFNLTVTPVSSTSQQPGTPDSTGLTIYQGGTSSGGQGLPPQPSSGPGAGTGSSGNPAGGQGRARHTADYVHGTNGPTGENVGVAGGYNAGTAPNAFDSFDRFDFDKGLFTHGIPFSMMFPGGTNRVLHASSVFLDDASGALKVLVTGGVSNFDPAGASLANQVLGASSTDTAAIYSFSPTENLAASQGNMLTDRYMHDSVWVPSNEVVIFGGASGTANPNAIASIEHFRPSSGTFHISQAQTSPRVGAKGVLMGDGRIFIAGGFDPASPSSNVMCEIYDPNPNAQAVFPVTSNPGLSFMNRIGHTVTRMGNGWILIAGGQDASGNLNNTAVVYKPETATNPSMSNGVFEQISIGRGRSLHAATRLSRGEVLLTGGIAGPAGMLSTHEFTRLGQVVSFTSAFPAGFTVTSIENLLSTARAEHAAPAVDTGSIFVIGGRNGTLPGGPFDFLDSIEFFPFSNTLPVVTLPNTQTGVATGQTLPIAFDVTDAEGDSAFVIIRVRQAGGPWAPARITAQSHNGGQPVSPPTYQVAPGSHVFTWDFTGFSQGTLVDVQIIPFGAVIGSPVSFQRTIP